MLLYTHLGPHIRPCSRAAGLLRDARFSHPQNARLLTTTRCLLATRSAPPSKPKPKSTAQSSQPDVKQVQSSGVSRAPPAPKPFTETHETIDDLPQPKTSTFRGTKGPSPSTPSGKEGYPVQLLIYHTGKGGEIVIPYLKLTALLASVLVSLYVAPQYAFSDLEEGQYMAALIVLGASVLVITTGYATYPYITYVHLALPEWARMSQPRLHRYVANLPSSAILDVTSLRWVWPRVTRLRVSELYIPPTAADAAHAAQNAGRLPPTQALPGSFDIRRIVPQELKERRSWYQYRPEKAFLVRGDTIKVQDNQIWPDVLAAIRRGWTRQRMGIKEDLKPNIQPGHEELSQKAQRK